MRVLLDEMLPVGLASLLEGHEVTTVKAAGFAGLTNGELLRRATGDGYDVVVTADRNMPEQQNIRASSIGLVLISGSRLEDIRPRLTEIEAAISASERGTVTTVDRRG